MSKLYSKYSILIFGTEKNSKSSKEFSIGNQTLNSESASKIMLFLNILVHFDEQTSSKMDESENFLNVDNPYVLERPRIPFAAYVSFCLVEIRLY